jgi:hypothetical protein
MYASLFGVTAGELVCSFVKHATFDQMPNQAVVAVNDRVFELGF